MSNSLSAVDALENESTRICREAVATLREPMVLYPIGKDSSVLLQFSRNGFAPGTISFDWGQEESLGKKKLKGISHG